MAGGSRLSRLMVGQYAGVCGLMIAGVPFFKACKIMGASYRQMRDMVPDEHITPTMRRRRKWRGQNLAEVEALYRDRSIPLYTIAALYDTSPKVLRRLGRQNGWPQRRKGPDKSPHSTRGMLPEQRKLYRKLQPIVGRAEALKEIFGHG